METQDFTISMKVAAAAGHAFQCINNVSAWWTENLEGSSQLPGDEFTVTFGDVHMSTQKLTEVIPGRRVIWLITDSKLNFISDQQEWTNTHISFEVTDLGSHGSEVRFTHHGLQPQVECYDACSNAWSQYIQGSLFSLITTGAGHPAAKEN